MEKILDIQWYSWWEWDNLYFWPKDSFYASKNIEIRKDLSWIHLTPKLEDTWWVFDDNITQMVSLKTFWINGWVIVCTENGKIYLNWVLKHTIASWVNAFDEIYGIWVQNVSWTDYIYYITASSFWAFKIYKSDTSLTTFSTLSDPSWVLQYSAWNPNFIQTLQNNGMLYIWVKNKVFAMDEFEIVEELLVLPEREEIRWITQYLNNYRIYTKLEETWVQYLWDWIDQFPDSRQEWYNQSILWCINDWAVDYVVLWTSELYSDLYIVQWTQKAPLRVNLEWWTRGFRKYMSIREWIVYISWFRQDLAEDWVYTYWQYYPWTPKSLSLSYSMLDDEAFQHHCHTESFSYFSRTDNKVYKISHWQTWLTYADSWYIITYMFQWNVWQDMFFKIQKLRYSLNWWQIKLYTRLSKNDTFSLYKTITEANIIDIWPNEFNVTNYPDFNEIQFKIELIKWVSWTPEVKRNTTWFTLTN